MNDYVNLEKNVVRELACRLCLCNDIVKLKPLSAEVKRKLKQLLDVTVRGDDTLPKAICHECHDQLGTLHVFAVKVKKTQRFLDFYQSKSQENKKEMQYNKEHALIVNLTPEENNMESQSIKEHAIIENLTPTNKPPEVSSSSPTLSISSPVHSVTSNPNIKQGDADKVTKSLDPRVSPGKQVTKKKSLMRFKESMPLEEFAKMEKLDKILLITKRNNITNTAILEKNETIETPDYSTKSPKPMFQISGSPAKNEEVLDEQISLFYKMKCYICHEEGFQFQSLMSHYKNRHGVPGYVSCCNQKFHYFCLEEIVEHMVYHL